MSQALNSNDFTENSSALQQEQLLLLRLSEAIPSPVFYKDTNLRYIGCNKAFETILIERTDLLLGTGLVVRNHAQ